jgi:hypothetical protein
MKRKIKHLPGRVSISFSVTEIYKDARFKEQADQMRKIWGGTADRLAGDVPRPRKT